MNSDVFTGAFRTAPGEGQMLAVIGQLKASAAQTGGTLEVIEITQPGSPPPHVHRDHEECFWVIEGLFTFTLGTEEVQAPAGSLVFVPRGTRHAFRHSPGSRALVFVIPAGIEGFFRELGAGIAAGRPEPEMRAALAGKYDSWPEG